MQPLQNLILKHWQQHHPRMLAQFQRENRLEEEVTKTAQQFDDLMYRLVIEQKMDYQAAWEIAIDQFLLPEDESLFPNQNQEQSPPETSA